MKPITIYPWIINPYNFDEDFRLVTYPTVKPYKYMVSNYGRIANAKSNRIIALQISQTGYYICGILREDGAHRSYQVHRLVGWEFCPGRDLNLQINHIDGNKLNNNYLNLEWCTQSQNVRHAYDTGLTKLHYGEGTNHKLTEEATHFCCQLLENPYNSYKTIINKVKEQFNIDIAVATLSDIAYGRSWTHISSQYTIPYRNRKG